MMRKLLKKFFAAALTVTLVFGMTACSQDNSWAIKSGDETIPIGAYICNLIMSRQSAMQKADSSKDLFEQQIVVIVLHDSNPPIIYSFILLQRQSSHPSQNNVVGRGRRIGSERWIRWWLHIWFCFCLLPFLPFKSGIFRIKWKEGTCNKKGVDYTPVWWWRFLWAKT